MMKFKMKSMNFRLHRLALIATVVLICVGSVCNGREAAKKDDAKPKGYNCLFMGHSFFAPIARKFMAHPRRCGFSNHKQKIIYHGGKEGAPGRLWNSSKPDIVVAKKLLASGAIELLGLTHYSGVESEFSDYQKWVDLALKHNPKTRFVIQAPWSKYQGKTLAQYEISSEKGLQRVHLVIDQLRKKYPKTSFLCIPQGRWMSGLWRLMKEKKLPEVSVIKRDPKNRKQACLFKDNTGHGGEIPVNMGALLWLAVIYKVDLTKYEWKTNIKFDLKKFAMDIAQKDPYCGLELKAEPGQKEASK